MIGIVCGFAAETRIARRIRCARTAAGARPEAAAARLIEEGAKALLSFGVAGGLRPDLGPGAVIVATEVIAKTGRYEVSADFRDRLRARLPGALDGAVFGSDRLIATAAEKAEIHAASGALALDMESHRVAAAAAAKDVPFAALRVVADPAGDGIPTLAAAALDDEGRIALGRVLLGLLGRPWELRALWRLGRQSRIALKALALSGDALAAGDFGFL